MWTCKQVSNALALKDYESLSQREKFLLKFHVAICCVCGRYNKQVMIMQDGARKFREHEEDLLEDPEAPCLPCDCKQAMKDALAHPDHEA